ncbi:MAG: epoxide hydrolase family protein [Terriglobales bacterium]
MPLQPFRFEAPQAALDDLRQRLHRTRWPDELHGAGWDQGFSRAYLQDLCASWVTSFDWRAVERRIFSFPNFRYLAHDGFGIHCIHLRGAGPAPLPLILTHGWPGSFLEMLAILPRLADPARFGADPADAFDVVVPSLPGFGFSDPPRAPGVNLFRIAQLWAELMSALGYTRFAAQGGDFGASVATLLGLEFPQRVIGIHLNYIPGTYHPHLGAGAVLGAAEIAYVAEAEQWMQAEGGYAHLQSTQPQTAAYGLNDSPAALAAWIVEKFRSWSDCDGEVESRFSRDDLLSNVTLYWLTQTIASSCRLYWETRRAPLRFKPGQSIGVPCGVARFPKEAPFPPRAWVERGYNLQRWSEMPRGGHFAAWEEPELLAQDIRAFFRGLR